MTFVIQRSFCVRINYSTFQNAVLCEKSIAAAIVLLCRVAIVSVDETSQNLPPLYRTNSWVVVC